MKKLNQKSQAFTLIELLVVIAIIGILAGMIVGVSGVAKRKMRIARVQTEMEQLNLFLQRYSSARGGYPPDNPNSTTNNSLYYELTGMITTDGGTTYTAINGDKIAAVNITTLFGVGGFLNSGPTLNDVKNCTTELKPAQQGAFLSNVSAPNSQTFTLLGVPLPGPYLLSPADRVTLQSSGPIFNPWHYRSTSPVHNPSSYDLWMDLNIGGTITRISNWSKDPEAVTTNNIERSVNNQF